MLGAVPTAFCGGSGHPRPSCVSMDTMTSLNVPVHMRFGDIDSYGHVNNVVQLQYLEDARVRVSEMPITGIDGIDDGVTFRKLTSTHLTVVGRQEVEYVAQLHYRLAPIYVAVWVSHVGSTSYVLNYRLQEHATGVTTEAKAGRAAWDAGAQEEDGPGAVYAVAQSTTVQVDRASGRPVQLTEEQRRFLEFYRDEPVSFARRPHAE